MYFIKHSAMKTYVDP